MSDEPDLAPGFFGKVTSHGDFVSRRLAPGPLAVWDAWLQAAMQGSRDALGPRWLETYLTSPIWRFALAPGVCDNNAWAGVLMPSVDRVGRHFPLTIIAGAPGGGALFDWLANGKPWFDQLENLALSSLDEGFMLDRFDSQLQAMPPLSDAAAGQAGPAGFRLPIPSIDALGGQMPQLAAAALRGQSLWWTDGSAQVEPCVLLCRGLPAPAAYAGMLAGTWAQAGWGN
ncbi:MAG: type VI secretion system-associated protein TagF [Pseudomonadota bacterium]